MRFLVLALVLIIPTVASAQRRDDALTLARVCAHEAGWSAFADCAAIYDVLRGGAARYGMSLTAYAHSYSGRALRAQTSRPWVATLRADGGEPVAWPASYGPWARYRASWLALLDYARALVAGTVSSDCEEPPHDWGGDMDSDRAERLGLIPIECGQTRNRFYLRPSLVADRE